MLSASLNKTFPSFLLDTDLVEPTCALHLDCLSFRSLISVMYSVQAAFVLVTTLFIAKFKIYLHIVVRKFPFTEQRLIYYHDPMRSHKIDIDIIHIQIVEMTSEQ